MMSSKKITGLTSEQAIKALEKFGFNELKAERKFTAFKIFLRQFTNVIVWILIIATIISYGIGEVINFWVINFIIAFVVLMGFIQEYKAERSMEALRKIVEPQTTVIRDGRLMTILAKEVVPDDILSLEVGDKVPADAEIVHSTNVEVDESMLTGESISIHKKNKDIIYAGTQIVDGRCQAKVTATGMKTKLGNIATMIQEIDEITPLQKRMDQLGKFLAVIAIGASVLILVLGIFRGATTTEMLIVALALAVAAVPEGLPLTMTLALSFGMHKMAKKNAIVRRMMAVETLGSTTVICTDKTGTLTKNEMTVQQLFVDNQVISVKGVGYKPVGTFYSNKKEIKKLSWDEFFKAGVLCNNAELIQIGHDWEPIGDPTEVALVTLGEKAGFKKDDLEEKFKREEEILFSSSRKMMTTIHKYGDCHVIYSKGAPEEILERCTHQLINGKHHKLTKKDKDVILKQNHKFAGRALRVLAIATKTCEAKKMPTKEIEKELTFLGLVAMRDPARPEVKGALQTCSKAGIKVMMVTGDNEHTAISIAKQIGLGADGELKAMTGKGIDELSDKELLEKLKEVSIFARTQPEHKLRIVNLLKQQGEIVAMTGDGVNDAPALKKADIGIAMGIKGTDVTKESADMILQDDNFVTIVDAVEEGRRIYENIEKFSSYLISRNFTEVILIFLGILMFDFKFLPLLAIQILFINAFDEEMPAIGLGLDKAHGDLMARHPRPPDEAIMNRWNAFIVFSIALFSALIGFIIFISSNPTQNIEIARTMVFATIVAMLILGTYNFRSLRESIATTGVFNNRFLITAVFVILAVTLFVMYYPAAQNIFQLTPLSFVDWMICVGAACFNLFYMEMIKFFRRHMEKNTL